MWNPFSRLNRQYVWFVGPFLPVHQYFYPSTMHFTRPKDGWMGLALRLWLFSLFSFLCLCLDSLCHLVPLSHLLLSVPSLSRQIKRQIYFWAYVSSHNVRSQKSPVGRYGWTGQLSHCVLYFCFRRRWEPFHVRSIVSSLISHTADSLPPSECSCSFSCGYITDAYIHPMTCMQRFT